MIKIYFGEKDSWRFFEMILAKKTMSLTKT